MGRLLSSNGITAIPYKGAHLILVKISIGVGALSWWLLCEYLRARSKAEAARWLSIVGFGGGWVLIFLAVIL